MRRFFWRPLLVAVLILVFTGCFLSASAVEAEGPPDTDVVGESAPDYDQTPVDPDIGPETMELPDVADSGDFYESDPVYPEYTEKTLDDYMASEEGFRDQIVQFFGEYTPRTQSVTQHLSDGSIVVYDEYVPGVAGLDWTWLVGVGIFALSMYCIFRMIGGLFKCL